MSKIDWSVIFLLYTFLIGFWYLSKVNRAPFFSVLQKIL